MASKHDEAVKGGNLGSLDPNELHDRLGSRLTEWLSLRTNQIEQKVDLTMDGHRRELLAKLDTKPSLAAMAINTAIGVSAIVAVLAFGGDRFDGGFSASGAFAQQTVEREKSNADVSRQLKEIQLEIAKLQSRNSQEGQIKCTKLANGLITC